MDIADRGTHSISLFWRPERFGFGFGQRNYLLLLLRKMRGKTPVGLSLVILFRTIT